MHQVQVAQYTSTTSHHRIGQQSLPRQGVSHPKYALLFRIHARSLDLLVNLMLT